MIPGVRQRVIPEVSGRVKPVEVPGGKEGFLKYWARRGQFRKQVTDAPHILGRWCGTGITHNSHKTSQIQDTRKHKTHASFAQKMHRSWIPPVTPDSQTHQRNIL